MGDRLLLFRIAVVALGVSVGGMVAAADLADGAFSLGTLGGLVMLAFLVFTALRYRGEGVIPGYKLQPMAIFILIALLVMAALWAWAAFGGAQGDWFTGAMVLTPALLLVGGAIYGGTRKPPAA